MTLKVLIGTSQKNNPEEAALEIITQAKSDQNVAPKMVLLFSTIHYAQKDGHKRVLKQIYNNIPKTTPLIGGSVAGFMNNSGVFTKGISAVFFYSEDGEFHIGVGKNTKRNPQKAAQSCSKMIKSKIQNKTWKSKFLFELVASGIIFRIPLAGNKKIIKTPNFFDPFFNPLMSLLTKTFQIGNGREDEVIEILAKEFNDFIILGGSTLDDNKWISSYQFFNQEVLTNSVVAAAILGDFDTRLNTSLGLTPSGIKINPTKVVLFNCSINKIDHKAATQTLLEKLNWPKEFINESLHRKSLYYPLCYKKGDQLCSRVLALVVGGNLVFTNVVKSNELEIYTASGKSLIDAVDEHDLIPSRFVIFVSCCARLEALGRNIFKVHQKIVNQLGNTPFILIYASGEDAHSAGKEILRLNESFNSTQFR